MAISTQYTPSKVVAVFLTHFDTSTGYKLEWYKSVLPELTLAGLDYKMLPSGIHEFDKTTVLVSHFEKGNLYYGLGCFRQHTVGSSATRDTSNEAIDRSKVKMYSLGVICDPTTKSTSPTGYDKSGANWKPNEFINNGWEYIDVLDAELVKYLESENYNDFSGLESLFDSITTKKSAQNLALPDPNSFHPNISNHLLTKLPHLMDMFGPLVFVLFKKSLLRKNIIIFNHQTQARPETPNHYYTIHALSYLISLLTVIPQNIETVAKDEKNNYYSRPIYNIGLKDLDTDLLATKGFVASTSDDILMYQKNLFDVAVILNDERQQYPVIIDAQYINPLSQDYTEKIRATMKDYRKFKCIHNELHRRNSRPAVQAGITNHSNISTDDLNSIHTKFSTSSLHEYNGEVTNEPAWWLNNATESISWRESIWSAFAWFASAGQVTPNEPLSSSFSEENDGSLDLLQLVNIVGFFHGLTRKWIYLINEIVVEQLSEQRDDVSLDEDHSEADGDDINASLFSSLTSNSKINLELTYQDMVDMELDPYCEHDVQFVKEFVMLYWGSVVDNVDIGLGIGGICC